MRATSWEFEHRALIFGLIFGISFPLYVIDPDNSTTTVAKWLGPQLGLDTNLVARALFLCAVHGFLLGSGRSPCNRPPL